MARTGDDKPRGRRETAGACWRNGVRERQSDRPETRAESLRNGFLTRHATLLAAGAAVVAALALAGCGAGKPARVAASPSDPAVLSDAPPGTAAVIARVGPYSIEGATLSRALQAALADEPASERPVPPAFAACVAHLRGEAAASGERARTAPQLRGECETRYREALQMALDRLIADDWLIGGAHELGVPVSGGVGLEAGAPLAAAAIRKALAQRVKPIARAAIASYYERHQFQYLAAGKRDLEIARVKTQVGAAKVKAEIESGKSFATVVKGIPLGQPIDSTDGLVLGLSPDSYGEPNLNEAIFTAAPGVLTGPIDTWFGWFVFKVTKVLLDREQPLAAVEAAIRRRMLSQERHAALATFLKRWRASWAARTDCSAGYVVADCRQFNGPITGPYEQPSLTG
jgi:hypothetical protein